MYRAPKRPTFETEASKEIYQYVERHGTAARHRVRDAASVSPDQFRETLETLITASRRPTTLHWSSSRPTAGTPKAADYYTIDDDHVDEVLMAYEF